MAVTRLPSQFKTAVAGRAALVTGEFAVEESSECSSALGGSNAGGGAKGLCVNRADNSNSGHVC